MRCYHLVVALLSLVYSPSSVVPAPLPSSSTPSSTPSLLPIITFTSSSSLLDLLSHQVHPSPSTSQAEPLPSHHLLQKRSQAFSRLLTELDPTPPAILLNPELPTIPNVFIPMTIRSRQGYHSELPEQPEQPPVATTVVIPPTSYGGAHSTGYSGSTSYNNQVGSTPGSIPSGLESMVQQCISNRSPTLPPTFVPEVGIVRLFALSSFRTEMESVKGCGCVTLQRPTIVESFVGSRNHSFAFHTDSRCESKPYFRRFKQHFDLEPARLAASIRIIQGVMAPIPVAGELPDM
ncbi:MAG: hypothetical protein BYD32DRAFT_416125, partial [Podila humilis]